MKNILITNFGTGTELYQSTYLISALKDLYPSVKINVITYEHHRKITNLISGVSEFHFIDSKKISDIFESPLYSDAFAINTFFSGIEKITDTKWDKVINYCNDDISSFLVKGIEAEQIDGAYIQENGLPHCSNTWSVYQNYVAASHDRLVIDKTTIRNHISNVPIIRDLEKIKQNDEYSIVASQNFSRIRQMKGSPATFIVGINLEAGYDGYLLGQDSLEDIIEALEESKEFKPVLMLSGKNYQKELVNKLNQKFNNELISINIDTTALPSVIANLDFMISSGNEQQVVADIMETRCIELREYNQITNPSNSIGDGNYIINVSNNETIASDILLAINEELGTELPIDYLSSNNPVYKVVSDQYGPFKTQLRGDLNIKHELNYHIERSFTFELMGYPRNNELIDHIKKDSDKDSLHEYIADIKSELTSTVKVLLATIRSLKGVKASQQNLQSFINYLGNLISIGKSQSIAGSIIRNFEGQIENIQTTDMDTNIKTIETQLFKLKADLQMVTNYMSELTGTNEIEKASQENSNV